jgi:rhodanese-related sulfurtransferase
MDKIPEFVMNHPGLFVALAIILGVMMAGPLLARIQGLNPIGPNQALSLMNHQDAVVLDVREDKEYEQGHILGSKHLPLSQLEDALKTLKADKDKPVIVVCNSGARSKSVCSALSKQEYQSVHNLTGGIMAWKSANLPLTRK